MYRTVIWNCRNPSLARDERNFVPGGVTEDNLGLARGFFPGSKNDIAALEDVSVASTNRADVFVIIVFGTAFLDYHANYDGRRKLD